MSLFSHSYSTPLAWVTTNGNYPFDQRLCPSAPLLAPGTSGLGGDRVSDFGTVSSRRPLIAIDTLR